MVWKQQKEYYASLDPTIVHLKTKLMPHFPELAKVTIVKSDSSYTFNKKKIYLCTEHNGQVYDDNMLTYVILHELAHVLNNEFGHGKEFKRKFDELLDRAESYKLWDRSKTRVSNYCKS